MSKFYSYVYTNGAKMLVNLNNVSRVYYGKKNLKTLTFEMAHEKHPILGGFIFFGGGHNRIYELTYETEESALKEFEKIEEFVKS